jgi:hypothetical protein
MELGAPDKVVRFSLEAPTVFWWMDRGTIKRREGRTREFGEDGAFVFANACPFGEFRSAAKSSFSCSLESNVRPRMEAGGKVRVLNQTRGREEC